MKNTKNKILNLNENNFGSIVSKTSLKTLVPIRFMHETAQLIAEKNPSEIDRANFNKGHSGMIK